MSEIRSIFIEGREWFDKSGGNTYFSCRISINGQAEIMLGLRYGHGTQYLWDAVEALVEAGWLPEEYRGRAPWIAARELDFDLYSTMAERNKRDMFLSWSRADEAAAAAK